MSIYRCWYPNDEEEDEATEIDAHRAEFAAEEYAEKLYDRSASEAFDLKGGTPTVIKVRGSDGEVATFDVTVDWSPQFSASEVAPPTDGEKS